VKVADRGGFRPRELGEIERLVRSNVRELSESWDAFFGN
jgi:hypothetical protein